VDDDRDAKESGFGISELGQLPADTTSAEAEEAAMRKLSRSPEAQFMRCSVCGQTGWTGQYPFSTFPDSGMCDDCVC